MHRNKDSISMRLMSSLVFCVAIAGSSALPFGLVSRKNVELNVEETGLVGLTVPDIFVRPSFCFRSPLFGEMCLPSPLGYLTAVRQLNIARQPCLNVPFAKTYVMKVCSSIVTNENATEADVSKDSTKDSNKQIPIPSTDATTTDATAAASGDLTAKGETDEGEKTGVEATEDENEGRGESPENESHFAGDIFELFELKNDPENMESNLV